MCLIERFQKTNIFLINNAVAYILYSHNNSLYKMFFLNLQEVAYMFNFYEIL